MSHHRWIPYTVSDQYDNW